MNDARSSRSLGRIGYLIPRLLVVAALLDVGLRFISIEPLTFRAWEALTRYRPPGAAFEPNRRYTNDRAYGDTAAMGNLPEFRQYRPEIFTTDALGFRNVAQVAQVSAILIGDSFAVGSGVSDHENLSSRLGSLSGCTVYNGAGEAPNPDAERIVSLARRLNMQGSLVIHLYSEDRDLPSVPTSRQQRLSSVLASTPGTLAGFIGRVRGLVAVSPLQIVSERALKTLADDRILPNSYAGHIVRERLHNGDSMLFVASHVGAFYRRREVAIDYWLWLRDELRRAHRDLLVVLVPGKYTVYRPLLVDQPPLGPVDGDYLDRMSRALRAAGVSVIDLTPVLSVEAGRRIARRQYLYWLDDIHWNADGIALAAAAIQEHWLPTGRSCRTPASMVTRTGETVPPVSATTVGMTSGSRGR